MTSGLRSNLPAMRIGTWVRRPQASAPSISEGILTQGVALSIGIWQMRPARRPITRDCPSFGRTKMIAKQYIAMMKLGFMPAKLKKLETVSLSTAPAAKSTAIKMRSRTESPLSFFLLTSRFCARGVRSAAVACAAPLVLMLFVSAILLLPFVSSSAVHTTSTFSRQ
ncbi:unknown [Eggerthella sp. CAG:298]|nr:unknown [Eggerthella sp. CAG:298]